jgi:hypothetical protein
VQAFETEISMTMPVPTTDTVATEQDVKSRETSSKLIAVVLAGVAMSHNKDTYERARGAQLCKNEIRTDTWREHFCKRREREVVKLIGIALKHIQERNWQRRTRRSTKHQAQCVHK